MTLFLFAAFLLLGVSALLNLVAEDAHFEEEDTAIHFPYTTIQQGDVR